MGLDKEPERRAVSDEEHNQANGTRFEMAHDFHLTTSISGRSEPPATLKLLLREPARSCPLHALVRRDEIMV